MEFESRNEEHRYVTIRRHEGGYKAEGPGFYVWDEDAAEVMRVARDLERGHAPDQPSGRFLVLLEPGG